MLHRLQFTKNFGRQRRQWRMLITLACVGRVVRVVERYLYFLFLQAKLMSLPPSEWSCVLIRH